METPNITVLQRGDGSQIRELFISDRVLTKRAGTTLHCNKGVIPANRIEMAVNHSTKLLDKVLIMIPL